MNSKNNMIVWHGIAIFVVSLIISIVITSVVNTSVLPHILKSVPVEKRKIIMYASIASVAILCFIGCVYLGIFIVDSLVANATEKEKERQEKIKDLHIKFLNAKEQFNTANKAFMAKATAENEKQFKLTETQMNGFKKQLADLGLVVN